MLDPSATSLRLLHRIRNGVAAGWRRVVDLYAPLVQHWCRRWGVQAADADDLVQEVFAAASLGIATFSHDRTGDTFRGWLRTITRHKAMDFWRRYEQRPDVFAAVFFVDSYQYLTVGTERTTWTTAPGLTYLTLLIAIAVFAFWRSLGSRDLIAEDAGSC